MAIPPHEAPPGPPPILGPDRLHQLCSTGFVTLRLPPALQRSYDDVFAAAAIFFAQDESIKRAAFPCSDERDTEQGYSHVRGEKEFLTLRYATTSSREQGPPARDVETLLSKLWAQTAEYLLSALVEISHYLLIDPWVWEPLVEACLTLPPTKNVATPTLLRVFRYEPESGVAGPHRDLGLLTLCVGAGKGLQVAAPATSGGEQVDASGSVEWNDAGDVTLLIGDTLRELSGGRVQSGLHRVVANPKGRQSAIFAFRTDTKQTIALESFGMTGSITSGELWKRINRGRVNVNAQKNVRAKQSTARGKQSKVDGIHVAPEVTGSPG